MTKDEEILTSLRWFAVLNCEIGQRQGERCKSRFKQAEKEAKFLLTHLLERKPTTSEIDSVINW